MLPAICLDALDVFKNNKGGSHEKTADIFIPRLSARNIAGISVLLVFHHLNFYHYRGNNH